MKLQGRPFGICKLCRGKLVFSLKKSYFSSQFVLILLLSSCGSSEKEIKSSRPNIIFLLADDQRADALGFAGNAVIQAPNIDKLAREGVYFENAFVTTSICAVSRASILSGQYARRHGIWGFSKTFTPQQLAQTYPLLMRRNGYKTGFIGKYGVGGPLPSEMYDYWKGFAGQGTFNQTDSAGNYLHLTEKIGNQIERFIEAQRSDTASFCLSVSFKAPHVDGDPGYFSPDPKFDSLYRDQIIEKPVAADDQFYNYFPKKFTDNNVARNRWYDRFANDSMYQESVRKYYRCINGIDAVVGRLLQQLKETGLDQNTVIIYSSDNGFYLGEYGFAGKWYGSEPSIRVPLIIYDPRADRPRSLRSKDFALNIDLAPTMLKLAGVDIPPTMQGRDLSEVMKKEQAEWREEFFYEHIWQSSNRYYIPSTEGVVGKRYKYMRYFLNSNSSDPLFEEMYDLKQDPHELSNLLGTQQGSDLYPLLVNKVENYKEVLK